MVMDILHVGFRIDALVQAQQASTFGLSSLSFHCTQRMHLQIYLLGWWRCEGEYSVEVKSSCVSRSDPGRTASPEPRH